MRIVAMFFLLALTVLGSSMWLRNQSYDTRSRASGPTNSYKIGAYYFGSFNPQDTYKFIPLQTEQLYGRKNDYWGGVKDFYGGEPGVPQNTRGWSGDFSHLKPVIGYYDDSNPETLEKHIRQATENGLSFFNFYWFWGTQKNAELFNKGLSAFLRARNRNDIQFVLSVTTEVFDDRPVMADMNYTLTDWAAGKQIATLFDTYFSQPNYLRLSDGRPLLYLLNTRGIKDGSTRSIEDYIGALNQAARDRGVPEPYVLVPAGVPEAQGARGVSGYSCLVGADPAGSQHDYGTYVRQMATFFRNFSDKPFMPCFAVGFDERPRQDLTTGDRTSIRYLDNWSESAFRTGLTNVKTYMDTQNSEVSRYLTLYAWNEWHEGGILEPNVRDRARKLNIVAEVFGLQVGTDPCRLSGDCRYTSPSNRPSPSATRPPTRTPSPTPMVCRIPAAGIEFRPSGAVTFLPGGGATMTIPPAERVAALTSREAVSGPVTAAVQFSNYHAPAGTVSVAQLGWQVTETEQLIIRWAQDGRSYVDVLTVSGADMKYTQPTLVPAGTKHVRLSLERRGQRLTPVVFFDGKSVEIPLPARAEYRDGTVYTNLVRYSGTGTVSVDVDGVGVACP